MRAVLSNVITVDQTNEIMKFCENNLVIDNPEYLTKLKLGKWLGNTPSKLYLYEKRGDKLIIPFGCRKHIEDILDYYGGCMDVEYVGDDIITRGYNYHSNIELYPYQQKVSDAMVEAGNGIIVMPCGSGKGLPLDAKVYTPDGYKLNGELCVGDDVIGSDGKAYQVTGIYDKGKVPAYKITFSDNTEIVCDKDHLWSVQKQTQRVDNPDKWWTASAEEIHEQYKDIKRQDLLYIPVVKPVEFKEKTVSMNPWLFGFLIGDGCFRRDISVSIAESDLLQKVADIVHKNYPAERIEARGRFDWRFVGRNIKRLIDEVGLGNKHSYEKFIPDEYKYNSIDVRLGILQGLFDADGYCGGNGTCEYSTSSKKLADDFVEIVQSLGGTAKVGTRKPKYTYNGEKRTGRTSYRITFKLYDFEPFTSNKHSAKRYDRVKYVKPYRIIKDIQKCEPIVSRCITVNAPDSLYVTDAFVVTHNTQTALHCVARLCGKTLWLTHTQDLLNQSMNRAKQCFGCDKSAYGTITAGKVDISDGITFATVQTMCKLDLSQYRKEWDTIIVDECQHCCGTPTKVTQFYKVINSLYAMNKFGLTATPKRSDGLDKSMYALLGDIIIEVDKNEVSERTCPVIVKSVETGYFPDTDRVLNGDGTINYTLLTDNLINDDERFSKAVAVINTECRSYSMVLANRVSYLQRLQEAYKGKSICLSALGTSKQAKEERKEALRKLNDGEIDCLFATYQLAAEGLDCPNLKYVVFATPEKNERTVTQAVGRVARKADGKEYGTVIDFIDDFGMYNRWAKVRNSIYKKLGCTFDSKNGKNI